MISLDAPREGLQYGEGGLCALASLYAEGICRNHSFVDGNNAQPSRQALSSSAALVHDDRLDAVAGAVGYWVEQMALDQDKAVKKAKAKAMEAELKQHIKNQLNAFGFKGKPPKMPRFGGLLRG
ncbi:hypothetical protein [Woodsholea maritima]|uniref:hypothetical protein n=1 Tax=Woodsholea maritima TaxID=240237 RepID=UPI000477428B|nr:hypothetical protein [Woodsholea maritima]